MASDNFEMNTKVQRGKVGKGQSLSLFSLRLCASAPLRHCISVSLRLAA